MNPSVLVLITILSSLCTQRGEAANLPVDWRVLTLVDCISPDDHRTRLRVVSHSSSRGSVVVLSVRSNGQVVASENRVRTLYGPRGVQRIEGDDLKLRLETDSSGSVFGELRTLREGLPRDFHCRVLR